MKYTLSLIILSAISSLIMFQPVHAQNPSTICADYTEQDQLTCLSVNLLKLSAPFLNTRLINFPDDLNIIRHTTPIRLIPHVIDRFPHDTRAFTQGLVLFEGEFYESTGLYGQSTLRRVEILTGTVQQQITLPPQYFAEGLALVDERLIQLTWRENSAFVYDRETFEQIGRFDYMGEGWGLCYDGHSLYMSDGTPTIYERDADTFEIIRTFEVTRDGTPQRNLNELACVGEAIYANIWLTDEIVRFDQSDGVINAVIDGSGLLTAEEARQANVLNGIVYDDEQDLYYITGKNWPYVFLVDFVPKENGE